MNCVKVFRLINSQMNSKQLKGVTIGTNLLNQRNYSINCPMRKSNWLTNYETKVCVNFREYCVKSTNEDDKIKSVWPSFGDQLLSAPTLMLTIKNFFTVFFIKRLLNPNFMLKDFADGSQQAFEV